MSEMDDFNQAIIKEFRANDGRVGGPFEGATMILIHHLGAKSGTERVSPLVYYPDGERMVIIASAGGAPKHPSWYHNLIAHPRITVEVGAETFEVDVQDLTGAERSAVWDRVVAAMPGFGEYQTKTDRLIPVLALTRR